jgi:hypothetical protein
LVQRSLVRVQGRIVPGRVWAESPAKRFGGNCLLLPRAEAGHDDRAMDELLRSNHLIVTREEASRVIRARRTSVPFVSVADMYSVESQFLRAIPMRERYGMGVLVDVRDAPMLANDGLEIEAAKVIDAMASEFERSALLVRTAVGALQVRRIAKTNPFRLELFEDEAAALAYLTGNGPAPGSVLGRRSSLPPPSGSRTR